MLEVSHINYIACDKITKKKGNDQIFLQHNAILSPDFGNHYPFVSYAK